MLLNLGYTLESLRSFKKIQVLSPSSREHEYCFQVGTRNWFGFQSSLCDSNERMELRATKLDNIVESFQLWKLPKEPELSLTLSLSPSD